MASHEEHDSFFPRRPIDAVLGPVAKLMHNEMMGGVVLLLATMAALLAANSPMAGVYLKFWKTTVDLSVGVFEFRHSIHHLIDDGLMVIFFFYIGLEVKRELVAGELNEVKKVALPVAAAIGGMIVPAGIYLALMHGKEGSGGWGIPMATDIAFVVGCMAVLGSRVPRGLRVILLSLAIVDDIGAILVIAIGYTEEIHAAWLAWAAAGFAVVYGLERLKVRNRLVYVVLGVGVWYAFHESGVHATIAGVIMGLLTPARPWIGGEAGRRVLEEGRGLLEGERAGAERVLEFSRAAVEVVSPVESLMALLHPWVTFGIMPLFALANAGVGLRVSELGDPIAVAVMLGLLAGKPIGVFGASFAAVKSGVANLPSGVSWGQVFGGGILAGIGFTMALFIAGLALGDEHLVMAKVGVLTASVAAGGAGMIWLWMAGGSGEKRVEG